MQEQIQLNVAPLPQLTTEWLQANAAIVKLNERRTTMSCYNEETKCGGIYDFEAELWTVVGPLTRDYFDEWLFHYFGITGAQPADPEAVGA